MNVFSKLNNYLSGLPCIIISGCMLLFGLLEHWRLLSFAINPTILTIALSGLPIICRAIERLFFEHGLNKISSELLISIAMSSSIYVGDIFAAGEIAFLMALGEFLENWTINRARKGIHKLLDLRPTTARLVQQNFLENVDVDTINIGDTIRVLPGETIPLDGEIISGETSIDQSIMTGESLPVDKTIGEEVFCGTQNLYGSIDLVVTKIASESSLQKLIRMVENADNKQAKIQRTADKWASLLVPASLLLALITYLVTRDVIKPVTILVVFCPCALVLATPTAIMAAIAQAAKNGVIIKSGEALERIGKANIITFDKTGTLTQGELQITDIINSPELDQEQLLQLVASIENKSEHPIARAILENAQNKQLDLLETHDFQMHVGRGVSASIDGHHYLCGNQKLLFEKEVTISPEIHQKLDKLLKAGKATLLVAKDGICIGIIALADTLRAESINVVKELQSNKVIPLLLTGDNKKAANYFAAKVEIRAICAELLPEKKVNIVKKLQETGNTVCMVGDGVNDAPALKVADVSVAMGSMGSDVAIETSDITLMSDDIAKLPYLKRLASATIRTINLSISLAMSINFIAIILSFTGWLTPSSGALMHNAGSLLVVTIAAMLYDREFTDRKKS